MEDRVYLDDGSYYDKPKMSGLLLFTVCVDDERISSCKITHAGRQPLPSIFTTLAPESAKDMNFETAELHLSKNRWAESYTSLINLINDDEENLIFRHAVVFLIDAPTRLAGSWAEAWRMLPFKNLVVVSIKKAYQSFPTVVMGGLDSFVLLNRALERIKRHYKLTRVEGYVPPLVDATSSQKPLFIYYSHYPVTNKEEIKKEVFMALGEHNINIQFVDVVNNPFKNVPGEPQASYLKNLFAHYIAVVHLTRRTRTIPYLRFGRQDRDFVCNLYNPVHRRNVVGKLFKLRMQRPKPVFSKPVGLPTCGGNKPRLV